MKAFISSCCIACVIFSSVALSDDASSTFTTYFFQDIENKHGIRARKRAEKWQQIIISSDTDNEWKQIHKINHFFNQSIKEQDDALLWGQKDYWASPFETINKGYGDCEDYAIAKFFSLRELGIPENKLRLLYARQLDNKQPHMVLIYYQSSGAQPLVLDNINTKIQAINKRSDLKPIYSFNSKGMWLMKKNGSEKKIKNSAGVSAWEKLLAHIAEGPMSDFGTRP